jgi:hypothetical protein
MTRRILAKLGLAVFLLAVTALPARAGTIPVSEFNGINFNYTATFGPFGSIDISFTTTSMVTAVNNNAVSLGAVFNDLLSTLTGVTPIGGGNVQISTSPSPGGTLGVQDFSGVVFDYNSVTGSTFAQTVGSNTVYQLNLGGSINVDPILTNGNTLTVGSNTYDFSMFLPPGGSFSLSLNSSTNIAAAIQDAFNNPLNTDTFSGSGQFVADVSPATVTPEPASLTLLGIGGVLVTYVGRRRKS